MERRWLWPFELLDKLGEGGMGVVYRARYVKNDRIVAVKLLPSSITDATLLSRFEREMQLLKTLRHPNIVHTFGGKCEGDQRFYAMELIDGGTIDELIQKRGQISVDSTIAYATQMCAGLAYAHEKGIVHRDVKPGNFLLAKDGTLKLGDFGLAIMASGSKLTAAGSTMGTFRYMAPEQIRGKPDPCPQTDLYALGVVLFEMLSGRVPFDADTPAETLHLHLKSPAPRVSSLALHVTKPLDDLVDRLLQKRIEDRPVSAMEVGVALNNMNDSVRISRHGTLTASRSTTERKKIPSPLPEETTGDRHGLPLWIAVVPTVLFLAALLWGWSRGDEVAALDRVESAAVATLRGTGPAIEQTHATKVLARIGSAGDQSIDALIAALSDPDPQVRTAAAEALGELGDDAAGAVGALFKAAKQDKREEVRMAAREAHHKITGGPLSVMGN